MIEPNKTITSFTKFAVVIVDSFVALYTIAIEATKGSSHNRDCGVVPICSGEVSVANTTRYITEI